MANDSKLPQWYYDLTEPQRAIGSKSSVTVSQASRFAHPAFFKASGSASSKGSSSSGVKKARAHEDELKVKRAWEVALAPAKGLPVNLAMSYFSGTGLQVVTISMTLFMFFLTPLSQLAKIGEAFSLFEGKSVRNEVLLAKVVYALGLLATIGVGVWKVSQMGLLPTHGSDWVAFEDPPVYHP